jgi:hypothetical protein
MAKAAILASPLALSLVASPAEAALSKTFTGFTDVFAPANWTPTKTGDGSGSLDSTTMTLTATDSNPSGGFQYRFNTAKLSTTVPAGAVSFKSGTATFDWTWTFTAGTPGLIYPFQSFVGTDPPATLWTFNGPSSTEPGDYTLSGTSTVNVAAGETFGFRISSQFSGNLFPDSTGTITNFVFNADYNPVPGPLPVAGAAAGFAWSRKLRRRLKAAKASA